MLISCSPASDWVQSPSARPDTSASDSVYVVLGVVCGICLLLLVLWVAICVHNGTLDTWFGYADRLLTNKSWSNHQLSFKVDMLYLWNCYWPLYSCHSLFFLCLNTKIISVQKQKGGVVLFMMHWHQSNLSSVQAFCRTLITQCFQSLLINSLSFLLIIIVCTCSQ